MSDATLTAESSATPTSTALAGPALAEGMVGVFHYTVSDAGGALLDSSLGREPMVYLHGHQNIVPGLEDELAGKHGGETIVATVPAARAYGERSDAPPQRIRRRELPRGFDPVVGAPLRVRGEAGQPAALWVVKAEGAWVWLDGNHPLAGKDLTFVVQLIRVREPRAEELAHGHPHGEDGLRHHH
jgi:FKBP-type peptidyl-prolyl cis-trans isomerase SlyD